MAKKSRKESRREAMKKRLEKGQQAASGGNYKSFFRDDIGDIQFWRPEEKGTHEIDIIDYNAGTNDRLAEKDSPTYCADFYVHFQVGAGEEQFVCPAENFGKACPICERRKQLKVEGADEEVWKALYPKRRTLYNVVVYDTASEEDKGVQVWHVSYHRMEKFLVKLAKRVTRRGKEGLDPYVDFSCPDNGKSISFSIEPKKGKNDFAQYIGHAFVDRDYKIDEEITSQALVLDDLLHIPSYEEIDAADSGDSNDDVEDDDTEEKEEKKTSRSRRGKKEEPEEKEEKKTRRKRSKKKEEKKSDNECPFDHVFGDDCCEKDECEQCDEDIYEKCLEVSEQD